MKEFQSNRFSDLYWECRGIGLEQYRYTAQSMGEFYRAMLAFELNASVNDIISGFESPTEDTCAKLERLRAAREALVPDEIVRSVYDIWEGHDALPVPRGERVDSYATTLACLADDPGFRPFIVDYRLGDPASAKGTVIVVPSVRASHTELTEIAGVFNRMGYNAFCVEPRFDIMEGLVYVLLELDAQRAIRYVRYHAKEFGIDPAKIFCIGGSKGNFVHHMTWDAFDLTPQAYAEMLGTTLPDYTCDEIDAVYCNSAVSIVSYGTLVVTYDAASNSSRRFTAQDITKARIYSPENHARGLKFPNVIVLAGTADALDMPYVGSMSDALFAYNSLEDKLYDVQYELHILNRVRHGFGSGSAYKNVPAIWRNVDLFLEEALSGCDAERFQSGRDL